MVASIPASAIVSVLPNVIGAGGTALDLSGLLLTNSTRVPIGTVLSLPSALAVSAYFGPSSQEYALAQIYFAGFDGSSVKPAAMLFAQYPTSAVAAYYRGGSLAGMTLAQLQNISGGGAIVLTINGQTVANARPINLMAATSFSNAAAIIQAAFNAPVFTVTFDSIASAFVFTVNSANAGDTIVVTTGDLPTPLALTPATGAVASVGAAPATPIAFMNALIGQTQNFVSFATAFEPTTANCLSFAAWTSGQNNRFMYAAWDTDTTPTGASDTSSLGYQIAQANYSGTFLVWAPDASKAVFAMAIGASFDFDKINDRATYKFRSQAGLTFDVSSQTIAANLIANGYNFYGAYATANDSFTFMGPGQISGVFDWADSYVCQIQLNNAFQLALMEMLTTIKLIPYNQTGYSFIEAALLDPIEAAVNFGTIQPGVTLSDAQIAEVNAAAGVDCAATVSSRGWYLSILDASPQVRSARASPPCTFVYVDGQSVQSITLSSIQVQ